MHWKVENVSPVYNDINKNTKGDIQIFCYNHCSKFASFFRTGHRVRLRAYVIINSVDTEKNIL